MTATTEKGRVIVCCCFMHCLHFLSECNVPLSFAYPCLWVWYARSLAKDNLTEFISTVGRCLPSLLSVCVCVCVRGFRCLSSSATIRLVWMGGWGDSISLMAYGCPWGVRWSFPSLLNKDWKEKRDITIQEREIGWDDVALMVVYCLPHWLWLYESQYDCLHIK